MAWLHASPGNLLTWYWLMMTGLCLSLDKILAPFTFHSGNDKKYWNKYLLSENRATQEGSMPREMHKNNNKLDSSSTDNAKFHDDVIKWKHFPRNWPFVRGIHRSPMNSCHKGQWRGALMFSLICAWINVWINNREAGELRRHRAHYDVIVMCI